MTAATLIFLTFMAILIGGFAIGLLIASILSFMNEGEWQ